MNDDSIPGRRRWLASAAASLLPVSISVRADDASGADPREKGPLGLAIAVHVKPSDRPRLRALMMRQGVAQFARWRASGLVAGHQLLFKRYADSTTWDLLVVLRFARYADLARWHEVEQSAAGGLPREAALLATAIHTTPMDLMRQGRADKPAARPTALVVPYDYLVSTNEYIRYLDGYLVPQVSGWIDEGIVSRYGLYIARYGAGRAWSSLFVIEYRDDESLGGRDRVVAKVRAKLAGDADWKRWSDGKDKIRTEGAPVVADDLALT